MPVDGTGLGLVAAGSLFAYAAITGKSVLASLYAIVSGQSPSGVAQAYPVSGTGTANPNATPQSLSGSNAVSGGSASGQVIASDAARYAGHKYVYGGAPGTSGSGGWDCSSFVSWVLGHDLGMSLPGGGPYNPNVHGPTAAQYRSWPGATTIPRSSAGAGDLACWETHIGIILNNSQMISALNEQLGTQVTGIESAGPSGESLICRRI